MQYRKAVVSVQTNGFPVSKYGAELVKHVLAHQFTYFGPIKRPHCYIELEIVLLDPGAVIRKEKGLATVHDHTNGIVIDCGMGSCTAEGKFKEVFRDRRVKADDIEFHECGVFFIGQFLKSIDDSGVISPLCERRALPHRSVDFFQETFADDTNFGFCRVYQPAFWIIVKIWLVVFQGDKRGLFGYFLCTIV